MEEGSDMLWRGRRDRGIEITREREPTLDPVLRLFLRWDTIENGTEVQVEGIKARMNKEEKKKLQSGAVSISQSALLMRAAMNLHYAHNFTDAAAVDGSKAEPVEDASADDEEAREIAEDAIAPAAYGVWEGVRPFGKRIEGTLTVEATEDEVLTAVISGLSGGRLPSSFNNVDCETYAILAYLRKMCELGAGETEADLKKRRVLIMSDCQPCLKSIETAYRRGYADGLHRADRGAMVEAITHLRNRLGCCVFLWNSSHTGASPSSYADFAAKLHLRAKKEETITQTVSEYVWSRPCIYERRIWEDDMASWELADRRAYREGRLRARANVRTRLAQNLKPGATMAGQTGRTWAAVTKETLRSPKPEDGVVCLEEVSAYNARVTVGMGLRTNNMPGMQHEQSWARRARVEEAKGERGPATRSRTYGCAGCRIWRIHTHKAAMKATAGEDMGQRRERKRLAQAWRDDEDTREDEMQNTSTSSRHTIVGNCVATDVKVKAAMRTAIHKLHAAAVQAAAKSTGGGEVVEVISRARNATTQASKGQEVEDSDWNGLQQVLAGALPSWGLGAHRKEAKLLSPNLREAQNCAAELIIPAIGYSNQQVAFLRKREDARGWMRLVMRTWREEVEYSQQRVKDQPDKWIIRRVGPMEEDGKLGYKKRTARAAKKTRQEAAKARVATRAKRAADTANAAPPGDANATNAPGDVNATNAIGNVNDGFANQLTLAKPALLLSKSPTTASTVPYIPAEPPAEKLRLLCIAVLTYGRVCRPPPQAPQPPGRKRWDRLRARLAQVVDTLRAQQGAEDRAGQRPRREGIAVINYSQTRAYVARGQGGASQGKAISKRRGRTTIAAKLGMYLQNWMRECGKGNEELRKQVGVG